MLPIDRLRPALIFADDAEDALLPAVVIVIGTREVIVIPFKIGDSAVLVLSNSCSQFFSEKEVDTYLIYAPWKVEGRPSLENAMSHE